MDADWSVEGAVDDPMIVVPWADEDSPSIAYVNLREPGNAINQIAEAQAWPEVHSALTTLNATRSSFWTSKCDAWALDEEERQLDFGPVAFGFGMYVDILPCSRIVFASLKQQQALAGGWAASVRGAASGNARTEFVIRPALWDDESGFAITLYLFGYGEHEAEARMNWAEASRMVVTLVATAQA